MPHDALQLRERLVGLQRGLTASPEEKDEVRRVLLSPPWCECGMLFGAEGGALSAQARPTCSRVGALWCGACLQASRLQAPHQHLLHQHLVLVKDIAVSALQPISYTIYTL